MNTNKHPYTLSQNLANERSQRYSGEFTECTPRGERVCFELVACYPDNSSRNSLPVLWYKHGYINRVLPSYWSLDTYVYDTDGNSWGRYNVQSKPDTKSARWVLDFDWIFEATEENKEKLIAELARRAFEE